MLIDWFTVGAQVLNFLVLVGLLKHFLYKPILKAIDAREKRIADQLADAAAKKAEAQKERDDFAGKNKVFDEQRAALLAKATDAARAEHDQLLVAARKAADALQAKQASALQAEYANLGKDISHQVAAEVFAIARKALADLGTASLEKSMGEVFARRLHELDANSREALGAALEASSEAALVRSRFELPAATKAAIHKTLHETYSKTIHLTFETVPEALCGIELSVGGQKLAWSVADYLATLEDKVGALVDAQAKPAPAPKPAAASAPADASANTEKTVAA